MTILFSQLLLDINRYGVVRVPRRISYAWFDSRKIKTSNVLSYLNFENYISTFGIFMILPWMTVAPEISKVFRPCEHRTWLPLRK